MLCGLARAIGINSKGNIIDIYIYIYTPYLMYPVLNKMNVFMKHDTIDVKLLLAIVVGCEY